MCEWAEKTSLVIGCLRLANNSRKANRDPVPHITIKLTIPTQLRHKKNWSIQIIFSVTLFVE